MGQINITQAAPRAVNVERIEHREASPVSPRVRAGAGDVSADAFPKNSSKVIESIQAQLAGIKSVAESVKESVVELGSKFLSSTIGGLGDLISKTKGDVDGFKQAVTEKTMAFLIKNPEAAESLFKTASVLALVSNMAVAEAKEGGLRALQDGTGSAEEPDSGKGMCITGRGECTDLENDIILGVWGAITFCCVSCICAYFCREYQNRPR